ncbi:MAG: cysteine desulfurase family protein [Clostridiales bacterium]
MIEIYFDNSATTKVCEESIEAACYGMEIAYGNPSSLHGKGVEAARLLSDCRDYMAKCLRCLPQEIYFTSGGSESNNTAIMGIAKAHQKKGKKILISAIEHPSVLEPALALRQNGFQVELLPVDSSGYLDLSALEALLDQETILVSVQQVNNEVGSIQPLSEIGDLLQQKAPQAFFHVDGVQGFGKLPVEFGSWHADLYTASSHKIHGPKGVGLLWVNKDCRLLPLIQGGGQERNLRSGTENVPGIMAFTAACKKSYDHMDENRQRMASVREVLAEKLAAEIVDCHFNSDLNKGAAHILNISFPGAKSEVLLHYLEGKGIYVSSGSACHSNKKSGISHVLQAMALKPAWADSAIRFSFSAENTVEEAEIAGKITGESVEEIRSFL